MTTQLEAVPQFDVADRMRKALRSSGVSVNDVAARLGVRRETVSNWINGRTEASGPAMRLFAQLTGVPFEWLEVGDLYTPRDSNPEPAGSEDCGHDQPELYLPAAA